MAMKRLYRARNGQVFGVCQGIANWRDLPVDAVRLVTIIIILVTGFFPVLAIYLVLGLILPLESEQVSKKSDRRFERTYASERYTTSNWQKEHTGDKERDWDKRFYEGVS